MSLPHIRLKATSGDGFTASGSATAHDGASINAHDMAAFNPIRKSADAEILPEWGRLTARSRDLDRNSPIAHGARRTITDNVIGTGLRLSSRPDYVALKRDKAWAVEFAMQLQSSFCAWWWSTSCHAGDTLNGDQLATLALGGEVMNGGALALPLWLPEYGDGYATKLQLVEIDRLSNPNGAPDSRYLRGGIAVNDYGAPQGYYIQQAHPGDYFLGYGGNPTILQKWQYIPRRTDFGRLRVIHAYDPDRAEQTRGKPLMAAIIPHLKQIDRYVRAEVDAAVANAIIAGIITTPLDQDGIIELFSKDKRAYLDARANHAVGMQSASLIPLFPGDKFESHIPGRPAAQFGVFCENILRIAACGLDMNYELLLKDFSKTTYTSGRMALLEAWRSFNRRRDWFGSGWMDPILELHAEEQVSAGRLDAPGFLDDPVARRAYLRCKWIGPGRGWVDMVKEAQGAQARLEANITTLEDECAEQGKDWREVAEQRAVEKAYLEELGLPFMTPSTVRETIAATPEGDAASPRSPGGNPAQQPAQQGAA